jgi:hypothetical protein
MTSFRVAIPRRGLGVNERIFLISSAWLIGLVGITQLGCWIVSNFVDPKLSTDFDFLSTDFDFMDGLKESVGMAMRYVTMPHYVIGFLFMVTSARNRTVGRRTSIAGLLALSGLLCLGYAALGTASSNEMIGSTMRYHWYETGASPLSLFAIILYFLVHELRDQAMFYVATNSSGVIADRPLFDRFVNWTIGLSIATFTAVIWSILVLGQQGQTQVLILPELKGDLRYVIALAPAAFCVLGLGASARWYAHATGQTVLEMSDQLGPLNRVFVGVFLWLSLGYALRMGVNLLILFHVIGWYVFTCYKLKERGQALPAADWLTWTRTNLSGFRILHIGLVIVFIAVGAIWAYVFEGRGPLWYVLAPGAFLYWTIAHITVSFLPR